MPNREFALNVLASSGTGSLVIVITNPLDCLKQRWQIAPARGSSTDGLLRFTSTICREQGIIRGLWLPGVASNACSCCISVGTRLGLYPPLRDELTRLSGREEKGGGSMFLAGLAGGALGYLAAAPFFYASRVAQVRAGQSLELGLDTLRELRAEGGLCGLWRGAHVLVARGALMSASQLATYDSSKTALLKSGFVSDGPVLHGLCSFAASVVLTTAICPLDVLLTRYLGDNRSQPGGPAACAWRMFREEGPSVFFRGWGPLWARFLPSSVLTFHIYEQLRHNIMGRYLE